MADLQNFSFGEAPVEAPASTSAQRASPAELVAIARQIWRRINDSKVSKADNDGNDWLLGKLQVDYKDFSTSFPLVMRWMVQMRKFNAKAFEKYLLKHASVKLDTRQAFLELQADYLTLLYREEHRHPDEKLVRQFRTSIIEALLEEDKTFIDMQKQVEKDLAVQESEVDRDRRKRLYDYLLSQKVAREASAAAK